MIVRVARLGTKGLELNDSIPLEGLHTRLNEGSSSDIEFLAPPVFSGVARSIAGGVEVLGRITGSYQQPCGRCADELPEDIEVDVHYICRELQANTKGEQEEDIGVTYYSGDAIDLEELIQESIILKLSPYLMPPLDEDDMCERCTKVCPESGIDKTSRNTQNLGELLASTMAIKGQKS